MNHKYSDNCNCEGCKDLREEAKAYEAELKFNATRAWAYSDD